MSAASKFAGVAMHIIDRPSHSPHRAFLRTVNTVGGAGLDVYHLQERKSGAARGCQPRWSGEFDADQLAVMQEVARRWNAHERLVNALRDAWIGDLPIERYAEIGAFLRELGEEV